MSAHAGDDGPLRLLLDCVEALGDLRRPLVVGESNLALLSTMRTAGMEPRIWLRDASTSGDTAPLPWPEGDGYDGAIIRLPKSKDALELALHAAATKLPAAGAIAVFGANAEGIRSVAVRLAEVAGDVETLAVGHHARVLLGRRKAEIGGLKPTLDDWRHEGRIDLGNNLRPWISYPGTFARGGLDAGSAFLIENLPKPSRSARVLDFAAGTGVLSAALASRNEGVHIDMIEADALALAAARENMPDARCLSGTSLAAAERQQYDLIVSNPPIHDGIAESHHVLERLIADAPTHLRPGGSILLVVQRRVAVMPLMLKAFGSAKLVADNGRFTVVSAERAPHGRQTPLV